MVKLMLYLRYGLGGLGLYYAFAQLHTDTAHAVALGSLFAVGLVGVLSFISHALLHEGDAKMIGFSSKTPSFQYEVGFANLAFGVTAIISYFQDWSQQTNAALLLAYGLYLAQAGILHLITARTTKKMRHENLVRALLTFAFSGMMLYIAIYALR